ncbi:Serine/threonine receptor-like kinase NFP [Thalictrum thalictroides]|uniref:Serine/threonine receptor-like kinase NFP n=1 Tax=Thalictrum thalictroides TaxID=46969 RepID=A0A7J6W8F1_THATH|nr:Serine/threonine receptor-like kinase NFP [Thalictrum thalictroides]
MKREQLYFFTFLFIFHCFHYQVQAQQIFPTSTCSTNETNNPCQTYVFYRAIAPELLNLANISDLFSVSRLMISKPSNLSTTTSPLLPNQPLLIPITCSCNSNHNFSYSNLTYIIKPADTFYQVSTHTYQNLTTYQAVEAVNPTLIPTLLQIGQNVVFPIFCKCPNKTQVLNQVNYLISYVFQPNDNLSSIGEFFGSNVKSLIDVNGEKIQPFDVIYIPVSRIPQFAQPFVTPLSPSSQREERKEVIIGLSVGLGVSCFLLILLISIIGVWYYRELLKRKENINEEKGNKHQLKRMKSSIEEENLMADVSDCLDKYKVYGIHEVKEATAGFSPNCLIQGSVYKGYIGEELYAIKKMKWNAYEQLKILQKVNHGNLVRLEGFSIDPEDGNCYLVYEYVENGSLYSWLNKERLNMKKLDWKTRLRIAIDVANGLQYIHEHTRPKVVHKDIKTSNILLDGNMRAKIANFGLAKSGCNAITMHIVGTQGYIAPEYLADGIVTTKMDVFSFGVVLLELITGKEAINEEGKVLWLNVDKVLEGGEEMKQLKLKQWMDEVLIDENCSLEGVMNVMAVAIACLQKDPSRRPSMVDIVYTLCKSDDLHFDFSEDGLSVTPISAR